MKTLARFACPLSGAALSLAALLLLSFTGAIEGTETAGRAAPLLEGMGELHVPVSTDDPLAQRYFNQGMVLAYGFNHAEAARSFQEAARLDPECALCYWGEALVLGPNINAPAMDPEAVPKARAALEKARALAAKATEREKAYIDALGKRYTPEPVDDRAPFDAAYADAMREVARRFPDDADAATLFAEALMDTTPWDYWTADGEPKEVTREILATLERVMERWPGHPGANHFYIHAVEAVRPQLGVAAADRLGALAPGAGHLVHMPSHIYIRVGRYHDASLANERAIAADQAYVTQCHQQGMYPLAYMPHNVHFLWAAATLEGRAATAIEAARAMAAETDAATMREEGYGTLQHYWVTPLYAQVRFGKWQEILATPRPDDDLVYPRAVWHYARGLALLRTGRAAEAADELVKLRAVAQDPALESITIWDINGTADLLGVAVEVLAGEIAAAGGDYDAAVRHLEEGVRRDDALRYDEPPPWHHPVRQILGAVLLQAGRAADAERVYREDLKHFPENGWSLFGLEKSLAAQGKTEEAQDAARRFEKAWEHADVKLEASRL